MRSGSLGPIPLPETGQKQSGYFTFEADPQLARYQWPFFSIVGAHPGQTFLITAGIHAAEYTGIEAAIRLGRLLDPAESKVRDFLLGDAAEGLKQRAEA